MKILRDILYKVNIDSVIGSTEISINKIEFNSLKIDNNDLFVAISGNQINGHQFISQVIEKGAKVILCELLPKEIVKHVTYIKVKDVRESLSLICNNFYDNPSKKLKLIILLPFYLTMMCVIRVISKKYYSINYHYN